MIDGQRDPKVLAGMARGSMRRIPVLEEALRGFFTDHHAVLLRIILINIDRAFRAGRPAGRRDRAGHEPFLGAGGPAR
ncbi:hypothetical protein [Nonomuraea sp. KM90]|uniref:hypothetical protein n=1 Tax=Nonomuraea sp. KM90 TaxID=3457428 RepID=UPI003FCCA33C